MKPKQMFIVLIIILLATTLMFPNTKEDRYCKQYSGESNSKVASSDYQACENDNRCKVITNSNISIENDAQDVSFACVPIHTETKSDAQKSGFLPDK